MVQEGEMPLKGITRREALRLQGPLPLGVAKSDLKWARNERAYQETQLFELYGIGDIEAFLSTELEERFEKSYIEKCQHDLGPLIALLEHEPGDHRTLAATFLLWGMKRKWQEEELRADWYEILRSMPAGEPLLSWAETGIYVARCLEISDATPHREPNNKPANQKERLRRDMELKRNLLDVLDLLTFPIWFQERWWTRKQLAELAEPGTPAGKLKALV